MALWCSSKQLGRKERWGFLLTGSSIVEMPNGSLPSLASQKVTALPPTAFLPLLCKAARDKEVSAAHQRLLASRDNARLEVIRDLDGLTTAHMHCIFGSSA